MKKNRIFFNFLYIILFVIITFLVLFLNTYIHEKGHISLAKEQNISVKLGDIEWKPNINDWGSGRTIPINSEECIKFNNLSLENKHKITYAGVKAELLFIFPLLFIFILVLISYNKKLWQNNKTLLILLLVLNLLFLLMIFYTFKGNVSTSNPDADWNFLNFSNCSVYG